MADRDPRELLREADRLRSYSRGAESARHKIKMRGRVELRRGILRFFYSGSPVATTFTESELDALYIALAKVRDQYEQFAKDTEAKVSTRTDAANG